MIAVPIGGGRCSGLARRAGMAIVALLLQAAAPAHPDAVAIGLTLEPPVLDPTVNPSEPVADVTYGNIFEGLTRITANGSVQPALATAWTRSADGLGYDFRLRHGVRFSDGTPFDCAVVRFSIDRARADGSRNPQRPFFAPIAEVLCPSADEAVIRLTQPSAELLYRLGWASAVMVAPATAAGDDVRPVGTGPYLLAGWKRGDSVTLVRNPHYWGPAPAIAEATFRFLADPLAAENALKGHAIDLFTNMQPEQLGGFAHDPGFRVLVGRSDAKVMLALNNARKPFDDVRARRALAYAIDRAALVHAVDDGYASVIGSHRTPADADYVDLSKRYPFDPARATQLLAQAGVAPGSTLTITLPPTPYAHQLGELIGAYLPQVGLQVTLVPVEWAQWLQRVFGQANYQATIIAHTEPSDLDIYARPHYYFNYHDPQYDALYRQREAALDPAQQVALSQRMQRKLADDEPNVFLFSFKTITVADAALRGVRVDRTLPATVLSEMSWAAAPAAP